MVSVKCKICNSNFEVKEYDKNRRKICDSDNCKKESRRLAMQEYRKTDRGKAMVKLQNNRVKRLEIEYKCYVCSHKFMATKKRNTCDSCIEDMIVAGYKNPELTINMRKWKSENPDRQSVYSKTSAITRRLKGRDGKPPTLKASCLFCCNGKVEQHHHNYEKAKDVTFLCKAHHFELHSWDSFN